MKGREERERGERREKGERGKEKGREREEGKEGKGWKRERRGGGKISREKGKGRGEGNITSNRFKRLNWLTYHFLCKLLRKLAVHGIRSSSVYTVPIHFLKSVEQCTH